MSWFPDLIWLIGEWVLLLGVSALVGLFIGWFVWRRPLSSDAPSPELAQRAQARSAATASAEATNGDPSSGQPGDSNLKQTQQLSTSADVEAASGDASEEQPLDLSGIAELRDERDALKAQRDNLRSQLAVIESLVGDAELSRGLDQQAAPK